MLLTTYLGVFNKHFEQKPTPCNDTGDTYMLVASFYQWLHSREDGTGLCKLSQVCVYECLKQTDCVAVQADKYVDD